MESQSKFARRYDAQFKQNALALVQSGRSISAVCRDLGCSTWSLGRWVSAAQNATREGSEVVRQRRATAHPIRFRAGSTRRQGNLFRQRLNRD